MKAQWCVVGSTSPHDQEASPNGLFLLGQGLYHSFYNAPFVYQQRPPLDGVVHWELLPIFYSRHCSFRRASGSLSSNLDCVSQNAPGRFLCTLMDGSSNVLWSPWCFRPPRRPRSRSRPLFFFFFFFFLVLSSASRSAGLKVSCWTTSLALGGTAGSGGRLAGSALGWAPVTSSSSSSDSSSSSSVSYSLSAAFSALMGAGGGGGSSRDVIPALRLRLSPCDAALRLSPALRRLDERFLRARSCLAAVNNNLYIQDCVRYF